MNTKYRLYKIKRKTTLKQFRSLNAIKLSLVCNSTQSKHVPNYKYT